MINQSSPGGNVARIEKAIEKMKEEMPPVKMVLDAFGKVFLERARIKEELPLLTDFPASAPDPFLFSQGAPLLTEDTLIHLTDSFKNVYDRMLPVLEKAFPKISPVIQNLTTALREGTLDLKYYMEAKLNGRGEKMDQIAFRLGTDPLTLKFIIGQLMKPLIEKAAESYKPLIRNFHWHRGYCPICGSFPELSYLKGDEGQRWLRCSLCGHQWRFMRTKCPFCENDDQGKMEFYFIEDRSDDRAEICHQCKRYIVSVDIRKCSDEVVLEVAAIRTVYLDILAQGKGFLPVAVCAWNIVNPRDISSLSGNFDEVRSKKEEKRIEKDLA